MKELANLSGYFDVNYDPAYYYRHLDTLSLILDKVIVYCPYEPTLVKNYKGGMMRFLDLVQHDIVVPMARDRWFDKEWRTKHGPLKQWGQLDEQLLDSRKRINLDDLVDTDAFENRNLKIAKGYIRQNRLMREINSIPDNAPYEEMVKHWKFAKFSKAMRFLYAFNADLDILSLLETKVYAKSLIAPFLKPSWQRIWRSLLLTKPSYSYEEGKVAAEIESTVNLLSLFFQNAMLRIPSDLSVSQIKEFRDSARPEFLEWINDMCNEAEKEFDTLTPVNLANMLVKRFEKISRPYFVLKRIVTMPLHIISVGFLTEPTQYGFDYLWKKYSKRRFVAFFSK